MLFFHFHFFHFLPVTTIVNAIAFRAAFDFMKFWKRCWSSPFISAIKYIQIKAKMMTAISGIMVNFMRLQLKTKYIQKMETVKICMIYNYKIISSQVCVCLCLLFNTFPISVYILTFMNVLYTSVCAMCHLVPRNAHWTKEIPNINIFNFPKFTGRHFVQLFDKTPFY